MKLVNPRKFKGAKAEAVHAGLKGSGLIISPARLEKSSAKGAKKPTGNLPTLEKRAFIARFTEILATNDFPLIAPLLRNITAYQRPIPLPTSTLPYRTAGKSPWGAT